MSRIFKPIAARIYASAVAWTVVFALVRTAGNVLVLPLMLQKLSAETLGLWYVFLALAGISSLVDMGFLATMSRATSYLWAGAREIRAFGAAVIEPTADHHLAPNYPLLANLAKTMRLYYLGLGIIITALMGLFGTIWIMGKVAAMPDARAILYAWLIFLAGILVNTVSAVWHPLLVGINEVRRAQQIMVWGLVFNYSITCVGLLAGAGLFAPVVGYVVMGAVSRTLSRVAFNRLVHGREHNEQAHWSGDILRALWPTAWRTGIVTLGIYATVNASTLICSSYLGLETTASFGLSLQLALAALGISAAFVLVKLPVIAQLHARGKAGEIATIIFPRMRWFWLSFLTLALVAILFGRFVLRDLLHSKTELLPAPFLIALFLFTALEGHHGIFRELALTANQNPFAGPVVVSGLLIVLLTCFLVPVAGVWGLILAPGIVQLSFNNWWTVAVGLRSFGASVRGYFYALVGLHPHI
jgi:O-antigen/teichoic acid export membrane protein